MGDFFLSTLRWVAKEDMGCMRVGDDKYSSTATVNVGSMCQTPASLGRDVVLEKGDGLFGRVSVDESAIHVSIDQPGPHSVRVTKVTGEQVFNQSASGAQTHSIGNLDRGMYLVEATVNGRAFKEKVMFR